MKKMIKTFGMMVGVIAVAWWLGGMMYFIMVTKHFRDKENYEELNKNILSYITGSSERTSGSKGGISSDATATKPRPSAPRPIRYPDSYPTWGVKASKPGWEKYYRPDS